MHIGSVEIENFRSFLGRQTLQFEPGFNLLVGTNNSGKTSVLKVLDMDQNMNEPHRSVRTIPVYGGQPTMPSAFKVTIATRPSEIRMLVGGEQLFLPLTAQAPTVTAEALTAHIVEFVARDDNLTLGFQFANGSASVRVYGDHIVSGVAERNSATGIYAAHLLYRPPEAPPAVTISTHAVGAIITAYPEAFRQKVYTFTAHRRPSAECGPVASAVLDREATTLPYCINHLQTNDAHGHQILCDWVARIFPHITWIQAPPSASGHFQLRCLSQPLSSRRDDLSTPLSQMGAGLGNVIAMLYVVLTSRSPQVIAIDEPNAFLHPRALRELLAILEVEGRQHQFILTTHSADVLTAVNTRSISLLEFDGGTTTVRQVALRDLHQVRGGLADLGIRITDLHAKDYVFWVEGQTEELVMPDILKWACPEIAAGTAVLRVQQTGTFGKRGVEPAEVAAIYDRLSQSSALVPPMLCILLDRETRSDKECDGLETASSGKLRFLETRMLENYLLSAEAVAAALGELGVSITPEAAHDELCAALRVSDLQGDLRQVDAASALKTVFTTLSNTVEEFRKTRDVPTMVGFLIEHEPSHLRPLKAYLRSLFRLSAMS